MNKSFLYLFILFFSSISSVFGQAISIELEQEIERRIQLEINPSLSIGILYPNGEAAFYNYGQYRSGSTLPDSSTLYEIGSVTKTFTATLLSQYLEVDLNTSLASLFSKIDNKTLAQITLRHLRDHRAGIPRLSDQFSPKDWSDPYNGYSDSLLEIELQKLSIDSTVQWQYSNLGYAILGRVLEKSTQQNFESLMGNLLQDASMKHSVLVHPNVQHPNLAEPFNSGTEYSYWHFTGTSRYAGGIISCTKDLINYLKYQQENHPLFQSDSIYDMIPTGSTALGENKLFYKQGWLIFRPEEQTEILWHNGGTGGFTSFVGYNKKTKLAVVVLSNSLSWINDIGFKIVYSDFSLETPQRTIAYELADEIEQGKVKRLLQKYKQLKAKEYPDDLIQIYWLERYFFGQKDYQTSNQLSDILVESLADDWEVMYIKGQNLEQLKKYKKAIVAYQKALALNPKKELIQQRIEYCQQPPKR
ncbi:MAG: serine hydrolase [Saprospiraceae bacterium]|nr:serine hydrolase [Saprospiraceae bacterium]